MSAGHTYVLSCVRFARAFQVPGIYMYVVHACSYLEIVKSTGYRLLGWLKVKISFSVKVKISLSANGTLSRLLIFRPALSPIVFVDSSSR